MQYRKGCSGEELSILGFGCMRLPSRAGVIDYSKSKELINYAIKNGVNYFDTAFIYHAGQSESFLGRVLEDLGARDKVNIATKLPPYLVRKPEDIGKIFTTQLKKLRTDHVDYYLMHALKDMSSWEHLLENGILRFIEEKKKSGAIKNVGFSFHGSADDFVKLVDAFDWDFCQIQWNYMDENTQAGTKGLEYAQAKGLPVIIMEPLLGGHLARPLQKDGQEIINNAQPKRSNAEWALRWIWSHTAPTVVLSGMSNEGNVVENIRVASETTPMNDEELAVISAVQKALGGQSRIPCTGCGYCMPCPAGVDIPECFSNYNDIHRISKSRAFQRYLGFTSGLIGGKPRHASLCVNCKKCVGHCPQAIDIPARLVDVKRELEGFLFKIVKLFRKKA